MTGAKRHHAPAPALRHRHWKKVAEQVDDVLQVVIEADAFGGIGADAGAVLVGEGNGTADPRMETEIFRQRRADHALADMRLDQNERLAVFGRAVADRA